MTNWLIDTFIVTSALMALVLVVRKPVARMCGPQIAYALWALPLVRLFLPPLELPARFAPHDPAALVPVQTVAEPTNPIAVQSQVSATAVSSSAVAVPTEPVWTISAIPWAQILLAVWLAGAVLLFAHRLLAYRAMRADLLRDARRIGGSGRVRIVASPMAEAPVAFGVFDKVVAIPSDFLATASSDQSDFAIAHEVQHHAGHDLAANFAAQLMLSLHWFNPLAWVAWRAMRSDQEAACDARVMAGHDNATRARYGRLIAGFAAGPRLSLAAPMAGPLPGEKPIVHRLRALARGDAPDGFRAMGGSALLAGILALPLTATISYAAADPDTRTVTRVVRSHTDSDAAHPAKAKDGEVWRHVVHRDGHEFVLETDHALSAQEIEAELASAESEGRAADAQGRAAMRAGEEAMRRGEIEAARGEAEAARGEAEAARAEREAQRAEREAEAAERMAERIGRDAERAGREAERRARAVERQLATVRPQVREWTSADGKVRTIRIVHPVVPASPDAPAPPAPPIEMTFVVDSTCRAGQRETATWSNGASGKSVMRVCAAPPEIGATVINALNTARVSVRQNRALTATVKADILRDLDKEIAKVQGT